MQPVNVGQYRAIVDLGCSMESVIRSQALNVFLDLRLKLLATWHPLTLSYTPGMTDPTVDACWYGSKDKDQEKVEPKQCLPRRFLGLCQIVQERSIGENAACKKVGCEALQHASAHSDF